MLANSAKESNITPQDPRAFIIWQEVPGEWLQPPPGIISSGQDVILCIFFQVTQRKWGWETALAAYLVLSWMFEHFEAKRLIPSQTFCK